MKCERSNLNKRGPWTQEDKQFISENHDKMSIEEICSHIRRNPDIIRKYITEHYGTVFRSKAKSAEYDIQKSPIWDDLRQQFTHKELEKFLYHWGRIITQFRDDVYPTEEIQVVDTIKLELLMNRCLNHQHKNSLEVNSLEADLEAEREKADANTKIMFELQKQIGVLKASQESLNVNYRDMLNRKNNILKEMKATRDARIKVLENSKQNFGSWRRRVLEDKDLRLSLGVDMEKMRLATEVEYERLSDLHTYVDGGVDQPFLTPESIT